jgi:cytochrome P450 family 2 subfamily J
VGSLVAAFWATLHLRTLLLAAVVFLFVVDFLKSRRPRKYPPGPCRLPFIGNLVQVDFGQTHLQLQKVGESKGVCSVNLGRRMGGSKADTGNCQTHSELF